jgi:integrase/recombinase XerD
MDVAVTITEYKERLKALSYADATIEIYRIGLDRFREYLQGRNVTDLRTVTKQIMLDYKALVMAGTQAMETKALRIRPVKRLFEHLTENNLLLINPAEGIIETCRKHKKIGPTLTQEEMKILLQQPNMSFRGGIRDRAIMEVLYATAVRKNELLSLEVHDVDLRDGVIHVRKGKGKRQRVVPLGKTAAGYLREYLEKIRPHYNRKHPKERRLFLTCEGKPLTCGALQTTLYTYRKQAGINKSASPHVFRRSCATHMLQQGADIRYIQKLLGHASLATTQHYCKVIPIDIKKTHKETHPNGRDDADSGTP